MARPKRFELLTPRFVVWAGPLKSLRSVTVRTPLVVKIGVDQQVLNALGFHKSPPYPLIWMGMPTALLQGH